MSEEDDRWISAEAAAALERNGLPAAPEILHATGTAVRREHHIVALAGPGSGVEALIAFALLERCDPAAGGTQALLLAPTRETALHLATVVGEAAKTAGGSVVAFIRSGADERPATTAIPSFCVAGRPSLLLSEVREGRLALGALRLLVVDGLAALEGLEEWDSVEALLDTLDPAVQKIVITARLGARIEDLMERRLGRARRWPLELFPGEEAPAVEGAPLLCGTAVGETARLDLLDAALSEPPSGMAARRVVIRCPEAQTAGRVEAALTARGHRTGPGPDSASVHVEADAEAIGGAGTDAEILFGLPALPDALRASEEKPAPATAIVEAAHEAQLTLLARRAGRSVGRLPGPRPEEEEMYPIERLRARVRTRAERGGTEPELLALEPLLREFGAARVAAALGSLLREADAAAGGTAHTWPDVEAVSGHAPAPGTDRPHKSVRPAWTRIYIGAGKRDDVGPSDLVGAIAGETGVSGGKIGKIEVRGSFSLVDIDSQVADEVIRKLNGVSIRGRVASVRADREA